MYEIDWNFFDNDFFKDLLSALIGTGTALLIFYMTLKSDRKKTKNEEEEQNKRRLNYLSNVATATKNQAKSFIKNLEKSISAFEADNLNFHLLSKNPNSSLDRLNSILSNENYFLAYFKKYGKKNVKKFNNVSLQVDFFIEQERQIWEMTKIAQTFDHNRKQSFVQTVNDLMNRTARLLKIDLLEQKYLVEINHIFKDFYDNVGDMSDLNFHYTRFIRPMITNVLIKNVDKPEIIELISEFKNVSNLFNEIRLQNDNHNKSQKFILKHYKESLGLFKKDAMELIDKGEKETQKSEKYNPAA
jgi:hypothetical protein